MGVAESLQHLDIDIFRKLNHAGSSDVLDLLMVLLTIAGIGYVIVFLSIPLWMKKKRELAFDMVVLVVLATVIAETVKIVVDRQRPADQLENVKTIISSTGPSFPSAHAVRAFAVATLLSYGSSRTTVVISFVLAAMIALSRVYLGVHWPSDILAGALIGISVAILVRRFCDNNRSYRSIRAAVVGRLSTALAMQSNSKRV